MPGPAAASGGSLFDTSSVSSLDGSAPSFSRQTEFFAAHASSTVFAVTSPHEAAAMREASVGWPVAPTDPLDDAYPTTNVPILLLSGGFDVRTPRAEADEVGSRFTGKSQTLVRFRSQGHNLFPIAPCARAIVRSFFANPPRRARHDP